MKVSVIVPVYNCEDYLAACIESVLQQTHRDIELILVDDGATDGSGAICDSYAQQDPRIRVLHQINQGVSAARNAGLDLATGDMVTFVDSDDTIEPDMYEVLVKLALEHEADIVHCGYRKIHFDGSTKDILGTKCMLVHDAEKASECLISGRHFTGSPCNKLYRRVLFSDIRFDPTLKINEDVWMNVQVFYKAGKLVFWDVPKYNYFEREQSSTRVTNRLKFKRDCAEVAQRMLRLYLGTPLEKACASRLYYTLLDLYRECLLQNFCGTAEDRKNIHQQIQMVTKVTKVTNCRNHWNYAFMHSFPRLYVVVYRAFDRVRKPNIDL